MGDALAAAGRKDEAKEHYQRALTAARALTGGASAEWVEKVQKKMSTA
jgi:predicted negative regulator of RcsB-dependent stress response